MENDFFTKYDSVPTESMLSKTALAFIGHSDWSIGGFPIGTVSDQI